MTEQTKAGRYDLEIQQGSRLQELFTYVRVPFGSKWRTPEELEQLQTIVDLTGYTARAQGREQSDDPVPAWELTTENGGITLGDALGTIALDMTTAQTEALEAGSGNWDLELVDSGGEAFRLLYGRYSITREQTR